MTRHVDEIGSKYLIVGLTLIGIFASEWWGWNFTGLKNVCEKLQRWSVWNANDSSRYIRRKICRSMHLIMFDRSQNGPHTIQLQYTIKNISIFSGKICFFFYIGENRGKRNKMFSIQKVWAVLEAFLLKIIVLFSFHICLAQFHSILALPFLFL